MRFKLLLSYFSIFAAQLLVAATARAQLNIDEAGNAAGLGSIGITQIIKNLINASLLIVGLIAIAAIVYGGFRYVTSLGDDAQVAKAKKVILYAIVGLIITFAAGALVSFVFSALV